MLELRCFSKDIRYINSREAEKEEKENMKGEEHEKTD